MIDDSEERGRNGVSAPTRRDVETEGLTSSSSPSYDSNLLSRLDVHGAM